MGRNDISVYIANFESNGLITGATDLEPLVDELTSSGVKITRDNYPASLYGTFANYDLIIVHRTWIRHGRLRTINNDHPDVPMIALFGLKEDRKISVEDCLKKTTNGYYKFEYISLGSALAFVNHLILEKKRAQGRVHTEALQQTGTGGAE